jgi:hypothetical protein
MGGRREESRREDEGEEQENRDHCGTEMVRLALLEQSNTG